MSRVFKGSVIEISIIAVIFLGLTASILYNPDLPVFMGEYNSIDNSIYIAGLIYCCLALVLYLFSAFYLVPEFLVNRKYMHFILLILLSITSVLVIKRGLDYQVLRLFNLPTVPDIVSDKMLAYPNQHKISLYELPVFVGACISGIIYGICRDWIKKTRNQQKLINEKMTADINFLRSQINPHFFFNSLNNIYAISIRNRDEETGQAILKLSSIMRYMIYDSNTQKIELERELEHIENYLELASLKFPQNDYIDLRFIRNGDFSDVQIAPLLFVPFIENAVKHGLRPNIKSFIHIEINRQNGNLVFKIQNSKHKSQRAFSKHSGIGLSNPRKRLELIFPKCHDLVIDETEDRFSVELILNLKE